MLMILAVCAAFHPKAWSVDADDARGFGVTTFVAMSGLGRLGASHPRALFNYACTAAFSGASVGRNSRNHHVTLIIMMLASRAAPNQTLLLLIRKRTVFCTPAPLMLMMLAVRSEKPKERRC